jgi:phenylalanyl-tRNA synthetase alpha chain
MSDLNTLESEILAAIDAAATEAGLEDIRVAALGKKGSISEQMKTLGKMSPEERKTMGPALNGLKDRVTDAIAARKTVLAEAALEARLASERVDVTLPMRPSPVESGRIHPVSQVIDEITAIFGDMGFAIAEGRTLRPMSSTSPRSTSPKAIRRATCTTPSSSIREGRWRTAAAAHAYLTGADPHHAQPGTADPRDHPGRTYRCDSDQTHTPMFHQVEGLVIDKESHIGHLKWILEEFCKSFFEVPSVKMRFRPSFFPFTEPSMEVDIGCDRSGNEVKLGEGDDWMEILGCGMVHPNVLRNCGLDPDVYQGFAWGMGIDRMAMLKYGMPDLRAFFEADVRWLKHYGFRPLDMPSLVGGLSS